MANILEQIESKYPVETILVNGEQVWPYLRARYFFAYRTKTTGSYSDPKCTKQGSRASKHIGILRSMAGTIRALRYGFWNWFRTYDYIVLSHSHYRREMAGKYFNRFLDPIVDEIGPTRVLWIEEASPVPLYGTNQVYTRCIVAGSVLTRYRPRIRLTRRLFRRRHTLVNGPVLDSIEADLGLKLNATALVEAYDAKRKAFACLFRIAHPKALLLTCYYCSNEPAISAAKSAGVKVIEVQHGVIGKEHPAYNVYRDIDRSCFPDHLLVFGRQELTTFDNSRFIDPANVHPVGSYYIDYIKANYRLDPELREQLSGYKRVVGVTLQWRLEKRLISFICEAAELDADVFYMLIPREPDKEEYSDMVLPQNVVVIRDKNFYELMAYCGFHSTINSTCALEAPALGVQNILVDFEGSARRYYGRVLNDDRVTRFADSPAEYIDIIRTFARLDRDAVCKLHEGFFAPNYRENIRNFVKKYLP